MVHQALKVSEILASHSISAGVIDLYRIKPTNNEMLLKIIDKSK
ncbi:MAG TPA: transketolase, partial [Elusimicrobia bacterium]|nr:transketolase [Elusimicrobiota bacterium]